MTQDTWIRDGQTCWHLDAFCDCGGQLATNGTDIWCTVCRKRMVKKIPCEVYSRIVGYLRPVSWWNEGKAQEFEDRQTYNVGSVT